MPQLHEQYRPKTWDEVVAQDKAKAQIEYLRQRGLAGCAYWIAGASGTGKTTIAKLLAGEIAGPDFVDELDATNLTANRLRNIEQEMITYDWGMKGQGLHHKRGTRAE